MKKRKLLSIVAGLALSMTFVVSLAGCGGTSVKVLFDRQNATLPTVSITTLEGLTNMDEISEMDPFGLILAHDDTGSPESPQTTYYLYNAFENKVVASYVRNAEYSEFDDFQSVLEGLYVYVEVNAETDELTYIYVSKDGEVKRTNTPHMGIIDEGSIMNYFSVTFEDGSSLYSSLDGEVVAGVAGSLNIKLPASFSEKVFFLPLNEDGCFRVWDKEGNFLRDVDVRAPGCALVLRVLQRSDLDDRGNGLLPICHLPSLRIARLRFHGGKRFVQAHYKELQHRNAGSQVVRF